eukprot:m.858949 g.858949  ORF g.858949 m.858949 type:complete len:284 (+) comp59665_c0_seq5:933-1784(+)
MSTQAEKLKNEGNVLFKKGDYKEAAALYSRAIQHAPTTPSFFTNRALCYLHMQSREQAETDCQKAVDLDEGRYKSHFIFGQVLLAMDRLQTARRHLLRASELVTAQEPAAVTTVRSALKNVQKKIWEQDQKQREIRQDELHAFHTKAIQTYFDAERAKLASDRSIGASALAERLQELTTEQQERESATYALFEQVKEEYQVRNIPDYVCCKISFEIMKDPVITPSGITYERSVIVEHLRRVGQFDPVSRAPLTETLLLTNFAIKEVIEEFIKANPWVEVFELD